MSVVFHGKISIRSLGVRGVVATSRNCFSEDRKFSLAVTAKEEEVDQWHSGLKAFPIILPPYSNPVRPEPNKAPEPTTMSVTSPADAGAAPATVVAHL